MNHADLHTLAMEFADRADLWRNRARPDLVISSLLSAARNEFFAVLEYDRMVRTTHEPTRSVLYRSAAALARQVSIALAEEGLRGSPDPQLRAELEELRGASKE